MTKTLTFFALRSPAGQELAEGVAGLGAQHGFQVTVKYAATQDDFFQAALADDVVVADASLLGEEENNYPIFTLQQISFDHILMVSRSYVPLNLMAMQEGGIPKYPFPEHHPAELEGSNQGKDQEWSNAHILQWLDQKLHELHEPRLEKVEYIPGKTGFEMLETYIPQMQQAMERAEQRKRQEHQVFISYLSDQEEEVKSLKEKIERGELHGGQPKKVLYFPPGSIAYRGELLSKMRRWMLLAILDRQLAPCEEVIIYDSPGYLDSWWTQGELITIAYRRGAKPVSPSGQKDFHIKVSLYKPGSDHLTSGEHLVPQMTEAQIAKMARYYSSSDPLTLGPESTEGIRMLRNLFKNKWVGWFFRWQFKRRMKNPKVREMLRQSFPVEQMTGGEVSSDELFQRMEMEQFRKYLDDEVFTDEFLYWPILELGRKTPQPADQAPDVCAFLAMGTPLGPAQPQQGQNAEASENANPFEFEIFTPAQLDAAQKGGVLVSYKGEQRRLVSGAPPRCLWYPSRRGQVRKDCLEILPVYVTVKPT